MGINDPLGASLVIQNKKSLAIALSGAWRIYSKAILYTYTPKILIILTFVLTLFLNNFLGLFILSAMLLSMIIEIKNRWSNIWIVTTIVSILIIIAQIAFLHPSVNLWVDSVFLKWVGLYTRFSEAIGVFGWSVGLLICSGLVGITQRWEKYHISNEQFYEIEERFRSILRISQKAYRIRRKTHSESQDVYAEGRIDMQSSDYLEYFKIRPYYKIKVFLRGFRSVYHRHGYELALFFLVVSAFWRLNILSLLYISIATLLSFCTHFFNSRERYWLKRLQYLRSIWRVIYILLSVDMLREYFFFVWFPINWDISKPFSNERFGCGEDDICVMNYKSWLSLDSFTTGDLVGNFISLYFMVAFDNYFYPLKEESERNYRAGDQYDFTVSSRKDIISTLKFLIFCYSSSIFLGVFVLAGITGNATGRKVDIISVFYLVAGVLLLYGSKQIMKWKSRIWKIIEIVNFAVLISFLLYQAPFFKCPLKGDLYYSNAECLANQSLNPTELPDSNFEKLILLIGLNKITVSLVFTSSKMLGLMLFFFFSIIQRRIWNHVYAKAYVEPYLRKEMKLRQRRGIHFIEKTHITRINVFRNLLLKKSLLKASEEEIDRKVKHWEQITTGSNIEMPELSRSSSQFREDPRRAECLRKIAPKLVEDGTIMYDDLLQYMQECDYDPNQTLKRIQLESKIIKHQLKAELHDIARIGLPSLRHESMAAILDSEQKHRDYIERFYSPGRNLSSPEKINEEISEVEPVSPAIASGTINLEKDARTPSKAISHFQEDEEMEENKTGGMWGVNELKGYFSNQIKACFSLEEDAKNISSQSSIFYLAFYFILTLWIEITYCILFLRFVLSPDILTLLPAMGVFCYAAVEYPVPATIYWKTTMWYTIMVMFAKFVIQLPFFCGGISFDFGLYFGDSICPPADSGQAKVAKIIGLYKFDGLIFLGVLPDFLTLIALMISRFTLKKRGIWHHVALTRDPVYVPQFKDNNLVQSNVLYRQWSFHHRKKRRCGELRDILENFVWNLFPYNVSREEVTQFNSVRKPGKDYHNYSTAIGVVILVFLVFFFTSMDGSGLSIAQSFQESSFSGGMVLAVTINIVLMLVDRMLYVSKEDFLSEQLRAEGKTFRTLISYSSGKKVLLHYFLTLTLMGYILTKLILAVGTPSVPYISVFFGLVSIYLYISAIQVKYGYPITTKSHAFVSNDALTGLTYKAFKAIPFLYELSCVLDWTVTKTSLGLNQWMKVEDAWSYLYEREVENRSRKKHRFGESRRAREKCYKGGVIVVGILLLIVGPLVIFSGLNPSKDLNNIYSGKITLSFFSGKGSSAIYPIFSLSNLLISQIPNNTFNDSMTIFTDLSEGDQQRMQKVQLNAFPDTFWDISPPSINKLVEDLTNPNLTFYLNLDWVLTRPLPALKETVSGSNAIPLDQNQRRQLADIVSGQSSNTSSPSFYLSNLFPNYLKLSSSASITFLHRHPENRVSDPNSPSYSYTCDGVLQFNEQNGTKYWEIYTPSNSSLGSAPKTPADMSAKPVSFYTYSDDVQVAVLGTNLGIITIYATFVLAIGRLIRHIFDRVSQRVIYEEMPETGELRELLEAISSARLEEKLEKEQQLYELFIRIYRSPEVLMTITGRKQKYADDETSRAPTEISRFGKKYNKIQNDHYTPVEVPDVKPTEEASEDEARHSSRSANIRSMVKKLTKKMSKQGSNRRLPIPIYEQQQEEEKEPL